MSTRGALVALAFAFSPGAALSAMSAMSRTTILGFGSLLSETSSRLTFPDLEAFRLVRVPGYRRVFQHPASIFFERGIATRASGAFCSLSAEPLADGGAGGGGGFVASAFEVAMTPDARAAFERREEEFAIVSARYEPLLASAEGADGGAEGGGAGGGEGLLCTPSTDDAYRARYGDAVFDERYGKHGLERIWGWPRDSGVTPCPVYLRHCVLAAEKCGDAARDSFLDETFLVDRSTTVRQHLAAHPEVMATRPPPELEGRYSG